MSNYIINFTDPLKGSFIIRPYTSNGPKFPTTDELNDTSTSASSTLLLYGKGHPEYGERTDENLLNLLENFSGASEPVIKVAGMLWHKEVLYYRDSGTGTFYVYTSSWNAISLFGTGALPGTPPVGLVDGDYWYDNTGSPTVLYQWSADERDIDDWIVRIFDEASGVPSADPLKELQIYDGDAWDVLPDLTAVNDLISGAGAAFVLKAGDTMSGNLEISKNDPTLTLTATGSPTIPLIDLVGDGGTVRIRGTVNWQMADNTDTLEIRVGGTPGANTHFVIDNINDYLTHGTNQSAAQYKTNIAGVDNALPNKLYVDGLVSGAITGDTFVDGGTFGITLAGSPVANTGTLTMPYSTSGSPGPAGDLVIPGFDSDNIPYTSQSLGTDSAGGTALTVDEALNKAAPISDPTFVGIVTVPSILGSSGPNEATNKSYVDQQVSDATSSTESAESAQRDIQSGGGTSFTLPFDYTAGYDRLLVFKNGVKQYKDELAAATAVFSPSLVTGQEYTGLPVYFIVGVTPSTGSPGGNTWTISGDHVAEFTAGDTFEVDGNADPASNATYTVFSVAAGDLGSPVLTTDIVVVTGSPGNIPDTAVANGQIGINYEFRLSVDGVTNTVTPVNILNDSLIDSMQAAVDAVFGSNIAAVFLYGGDIRIDNLSSPAGSPAPTISMSFGISNATSDLFDTNNLGQDGFTGGFNIGVTGTQWAYFESDGAGTPANAPGGTSATDIEFNTTTLVTDVIEFLSV